MVRKVNEQAAKNEARMEMALDSVDTHAMQIEADAEALRAQDLVQQMKMEMGLAEPPAQTRTTGRVQLPEGGAPDSDGGTGGARTRTE